MMNLTGRRMAIAAVALSPVLMMPLIASIAVAQVPLPATPPVESTTPRSPAPGLQPLPGNPAPAEVQPPAAPFSQDTTLSCAPNQFASRFSDVPPDHWAYEAVNRIASGELQCFPVSPQS